MRRRAGFTFVELLIAATMMSILVVGLGAHLQGGIKVWRAATTTVEAMQQRQAVFAQLERDLANATLYDAKDTTFRTQGEPGIHLGEHTLQWFTINRTGQGPGRVRVVVYRCEPMEGQSWLVRTSQSISGVKAGKEPQRERLLAGCDNFAVRYGFLPPPPGTQPVQLQWKATWPDSEDDAVKLPRLLEVTLQIAHQPEIRRVFTIPIGVLEPYEATPS